jgi:selenocysteine-specific elongation factor
MFSDSRHTIIGTAGHIDHGKTALVKALTGIDLDTLPDEKKRGITIELGFAFMDAPECDNPIVFIDVPGHERLIKTMVAGASSIDAVLFVIAADEGISPQSVEHFDIVQLLGIEEGVIVLNKADLVDDDRLRTLSGEVARFIEGTTLEGAPIIAASSLTGKGIDEVRSALILTASKSHDRPDSGTFRMPIDRVFTSKGFGTVVAGTVLSGEVKIGDRVEILPESMTARVRGLQIHGENVERSSIGKRTAINLQDVKKEQMRRGQCAAALGTISPTTRIDARLSVLKTYGEELKNRTRIRFHTGTDEVIGRVILLDRDTLPPGETGLVQFVLESPTTAARKDRFIIRMFSPQRTIGGGIILDAHASAHKRSDISTVDSLTLSDRNICNAVEQACLKARNTPQDSKEIATAIRENPTDVENAVSELLADGRLIALGQLAGGNHGHGAQRYMHSTSYEDLTQKLLGIVGDYYNGAPYRLFMPSSSLQSKFVTLADKQIYDRIIEDLCSRQILTRKDSRIGISTHEIKWQPGEREGAGRIEALFRDAHFATPALEDALAELRLPRKLFESLLEYLMDQDLLVKIDEKIVYHRDSFLAARNILVEYLKKNGSITASEFRDKLGVTRRYAIPLLEYFDGTSLTRREGDYRVLRQQG